jgi:hypothetical protein
LYVLHHRLEGFVGCYGLLLSLINGWNRDSHGVLS